jgi:alkylation response protein AidB-like acyl-CoA dehydrogenase
VFLPRPILDSCSQQLSQLADAVLTPQIFTWINNAELYPPTTTTHDLAARPETKLQTSEGWRNLQDFGIKHGIWTSAYNDEPSLGEFARVVQFLKYHIWTASSAITTCPAAMADGAASLLARHIASSKGDPEFQKVFVEARERLLSTDPEKAWTSGQWMTERSGGSDVRGTETLASLVEASHTGKDASGHSLGPWSISGFKFFSSATDSQMTILLARTSANEISAFYAPMYLSPNDTQKHKQPCLNGIKISRLKPKVGTRPLPTAELELNDMRAYMLGKPGQGTKELSTVLTITRVHTAISALGFWGRGLAIARAYSRVRKVAGGTLLVNVPSHVRSLASMTVEYAGNMAFGFFTVACLGISTSTSSSPSKSGHSPLLPSKEAATHLLRLLTPICKAQISTAACTALRACTEALGGIGYLEDPSTPHLNVARLLRDCLVLPIWEGTTDVLASDVVRVLFSPHAGQAAKRALRDWIHGVTDLWKEPEWKDAQRLVRREWGIWDETVENMTSRAEMTYRGREIMERLASLVSSVVLVEDARKDGDPISGEIAKRWLAMKAGMQMTRKWDDLARWDRRIVFPDLQDASLDQSLTPKL